MTIEEKRRAIINAYPGADWLEKVEKMPDKQIYAIYRRLELNGKLKERIK